MYVRGGVEGEGAYLRGEVCVNVSVVRACACVCACVFVLFLFACVRADGRARVCGGAPTVEMVTVEK